MFFKAHEIQGVICRRSGIHRQIKYIDNKLNKLTLDFQSPAHAPFCKLNDFNCSTIGYHIRFLFQLIELHLFWRISQDMSTSLFIVFCLLLSTETILICIGNSFTICAFLKKRRTLHKAYYLLINLAIADLLVGIQMIISLGTQSVPFLFTDYNLLMFSLLILFSCSSLFSLADISLERVYAVVWPLRHRTVNYRVYFGSIAFIWAAGICAAVLFILSVGPFLRPMFPAVAINITILSSLCVVCTSYVIIRCRLRRPFPVFDNQTRRDMARNLKLSKTLFMVIGLSLICWVPAALLYVVHFVCQDCISQTVMLVTKALHVANSIVNLVVYSYRMPIFKEELTRCLKGNDDTCGPEIFEIPL